MIRLSRRSTAAGAVAQMAVLTAVLAVAGCGSSPTSSGSPHPGTSQNANASSFRQCMQQHGVALPSGGFPGGGPGASPRPRPAGARSASFQQAIKACGGKGGFGGGFAGGGAGPAG